MMEKKACKTCSLCTEKEKKIKEINLIISLTMLNMIWRYPMEMWLCSYVYLSFFLNLPSFLPYISLYCNSFSMNRKVLGQLVAFVNAYNLIIHRYGSAICMQNL